jgi:hypothetical protein
VNGILATQASLQLAAIGAAFGGKEAVREFTKFVQKL